MKKLLVVLILSILLMSFLSFAIAKNNSDDDDEEDGNESATDDEDDNENEINDENEIECDDYTYSTCPVGCTKKCVSSSNCSEDNESCIGTTDCEGENSCYEKEDKEWRKGNLTREQFKQAIQQNKAYKFEERTGQTCIEGCTCQGVVMKCMLEDGTREMTIYAKSGNVIIQTKGINASTQVILYKVNKTIIAELKNGTIKEIKVMPDELKEKIRAKLQKKLTKHNIIIDEDGYYQVRAKKAAKFLGLFPVKETIRITVDPETGEITKRKTSWWGFLALDETEPTPGAESETGAGSSE